MFVCLFLFVDLVVYAFVVCFVSLFCPLGSVRWRVAPFSLLLFVCLLLVVLFICVFARLFCLFALACVLVCFAVLLVCFV